MPAINFKNLSVLLLFATAAHAVIPVNVTTRNFFGTLTFNRPVAVAAIPGMDSQFVVLEQWLNGSTTTGQVTLVRYVAGAWTKSVFDTVTFSGAVTTNRELGLTGFAFHPAFLQNRKYYVGYTPSYNSASTPPGKFWLVERVADSTLLKRNNAIPSRTLLDVASIGNAETGGGLGFGPQDGYLYVGLGDGGGVGDPGGRAQNLDSLQGKILRINVDSIPAGKTYAIPADNPFAGQAGKKGEVWAYGLRHPWRWTIHPTNGSMMVGDLGVDTQDEISPVAKGANLGWPIQEGTACYPSTATCSSAGLTAPFFTRKGESIIGGVFFLGSPSGQFNGTYFFANSTGGQVWAMRMAGGIVTDAATQLTAITTTNPSSFATDNQGRVLLARLGTTSTGINITANSGTVLVLESPDMVLSPATALRDAGRTVSHRAPRFSRIDILRNRDQYILKTLDGRLAAGIPTGAFVAAKKGSPESAQILSGVWD